jgi:hypothetical protein
MMTGLQLAAPFSCAGRIAVHDYERLARTARVVPRRTTEETVTHGYEKTTRTRAIHLIERCYPPDSPTPTNAAIGQELLHLGDQGRPRG